MRLGLVLVCLFLVSTVAFGQGGNASITGTVTDPAGAVVGGASIELKQVETGVVYPAASTNTGNYTVSNLPVGKYTMTVKVPGFKTYTHSNLELQVAAVVKEDVALQVGAQTDAVTVTAE